MLVTVGLLLSVLAGSPEPLPSSRSVTPDMSSSTNVVGLSRLQRLPDYVAARRAYDAFAIDDAHRRFRALVRQRTWSEVERAHLLLWVGMCDAERGDLVAAASAFSAATAADPDVAALPAMSPRARAMLDDARRHTERAPPAQDVPVNDVAPPVSPSPPRPSVAVAARGPGPLLWAGGGTLVAGIVVAAGSAWIGGAAQQASTEARALQDADAARARQHQAEGLAGLANGGFLVAGVAGVVGVAVCAWAGLPSTPTPGDG